MAAATQSPKKPAPLLPPPETFWRKYSPHHEFPFSTVFSLFLHGAFFGLVALLGYLLQKKEADDYQKMVKNDVVFVQGGGEPAGGGGPAGFPGDGGIPVVVKVPGEADPSDFFDPMEDLPSEPIPLDPGTVDLEGGEETPQDFLKELAVLGKEPAEKKAAPKEVSKTPSKRPPMSIPGPGFKKKRGIGGVPGGALGTGGKGVGTGIGSGFGPGKGPGGSGGSEDDYKAWKWKFDLSGPPKTHLDKLAKTGIIVVLIGADNRFYRVGNLSSRPVEIRLDSAEKYQQGIRWVNQDPGSVFGVVNEMGLASKMKVKGILMLLPTENAERVYKEELRFQKTLGRPLHPTERIEFDLELRGGHYEPRAVRVVPG